jgi:hypothetical protein
MNEFPWPMDKPIDEIDNSSVMEHWIHRDRKEYVQYLLTRLKKAESESELKYNLIDKLQSMGTDHVAEMREVIQALEDQYQCNGGLYSELVKVLDKYRHYLDKGE